jgi:hypothetical protein
MLRYLLVAALLCLGNAAYAESIGLSPPIPLTSTTWTPAIAFGGSSAGVTYNVQAGDYRIVNRLLCLSGRILLTSNGSGSGSATITGLPVAVNNATGSYGVFSFGYWSATSSVAGNPTGLASPNTSTISVFMSSATAATAMTETNITDTAELIFSGCYPI